MIGRSIRQRLIFLTILVLALALLGSLLIANRAFNLTLRESTYRQLADNAAYLKSILEEDGFTIEPARFDPYAHATNLRITIIGFDGTVLYDSDFDESALDNHLYRQEVQDALREGFATSERRSATQRLPVLYHAVRIDEEPQIAVLRLSTALAQLRGYQEIYRELSIGNIAILILLVAIATALSITMITRPLKRIKAAAARYAEGRLETRIRVDGPSELTELAHIMQEMATRLRSNIREVESGRREVQTILESMKEGILLVDRDLVIKVANSSARDLLFTQASSPEREIEGSLLPKILSSSEIINSCRHTLADGKMHELTIAHHEHLFGETAAILAKGKARTLRVMTVPVRSDGDLIEGVVITVNDITELRRLEQMRKDFVANVSHELKTPITAIAGFAHALQEGAKENPGELEHFLAIITRQARNMQRIVEDLLLLSSLEQQQASPVKSWIAVEQLLAETVESCRFRAEERHTTILTGIEDPAHLDVFVNGSLMVQALGNLVVNAITYSDEHSSVRLEAKVEEQYVTFTVSDTGQGIPKEALQRIFERFYRVDAARSRNQGGTGLGLSIVKHIVQVHGGTVTVESELGKGSTFTITLPRSTREMGALKTRSDALFSSST
jgi:two-component system phosphate regulon sensor histidine kinase PhoR